VNRREARPILKEIRIGKTLCWACEHFQEEASAEGYSLEDVWVILREFSFDGEPEHRHTGVWRVRLDGVSKDGRPTRLVIDLDPNQVSTYVTVYSLRVI
jgi:hypothetical protein